MLALMKAPVGGAALLTVALATLGGARAAVAAPPPTVVIGGRITFRDAVREARSEEVERLRWGHIVIEIRNGWNVFTARPDANGLFTITGPPGIYRLEYVRVGQLAEFFVPHEAVATRGAFTCLGTIEVSVRDITQDLGNNVSSQLSVRDDCAAIAPGLRQLAATAADGAPVSGADAEIRASLPRPVTPPMWTPHPLAVLVAFRADVAFATTLTEQTKLSSLRADFVLPVGHGDSVGHWLAGATLIRVGSDFTAARFRQVGTGAAQTVWGGAVGAGHELWLFEAMAWGGAIGNPGFGARGPFVGGSLRFGSFTWGLGGRMDYYPSTGDSVGSFMIDLSPIGLLGHLL
jgi:hypothetical protein